MNDFADDIAAIADIEAVPQILDIVCRTTGMGYAAVTRVTEDRWIVCRTRDPIDHATAATTRPRGAPQGGTRGTGWWSTTNRPCAC